jgi:hypothetical protein
MTTKNDDDYTWVIFNGHSQRITNDELLSILKDHPGIMTPEEFYEWKDRKEIEFAAWYDNKFNSIKDKNIDAIKFMENSLKEVDSETMEAIEYDNYSDYLETKLNESRNR